MWHGVALCGGSWHGVVWHGLESGDVVTLKELKEGKTGARCDDLLAKNCMTLVRNDVKLKKGAWVCNDVLVKNDANLAPCAQ